MKITDRPSAERGGADHGWLKTRHSFSFADYYDPAWMGFGPLRVINEDLVAPGTGFGTHGHRDMEIISWPLAGRMRHQDSLGHGADLPPGTTQVMSAGSGIRHSEMNPGPDTVHFLQVWIEPAVRGASPRYADKVIEPTRRAGRFTTIAAPEGSPEVEAGEALPIRQHARVLVGDFAAGQGAEHALAPGRRLWVHVATGSAEVAGRTLGPGDGLGIEDATAIPVRALSTAQVLLFDLP